MPKAAINGLTVHYQQMGRGPELVMIHGLFSNLAFWYLGVLLELIRNFRVTTYDLRGHGYSDMPRSGYTSFDMTADLNALLDHVGVRQAHIVGHSFGGAVALHYTSIHPERVLSLTLADARVPALQPALPPRSGRRWRVRNARLRRAGINVPDDLPCVAYSFLEELTRLPNSWIGRANAICWPGQNQGRWNSDSRAAKQWSQLMRTTSAAKDLRNLSGLTRQRISEVVRPTLAIFGQQSGCLRTLRGIMRCLPNCSRVIVPGVGHFHPILKPEVFIDELRRFIASVEGNKTGLINSGGTRAQETRIVSRD